MKKFWPLLILLISSLFIISCDNSDDNDSNNNNVNVEYPAVFDLPVTFQMGKDNNGNNDPTFFTYQHNFSGMLTQDIALVYRKANPGSNDPRWEPLPRTYFFGSNAMDYTYNFQTNIVNLQLSADFDLTKIYPDYNPQNYVYNQTFRVVLVPTIYGNKNANAADLRKMSYEDVIKKYNINDSNVTTLK